MFEFRYSILSIIIIISISVLMVLVFSFIKTYLPVFFKGFKPNEQKFRRWIYISEFIFVLAVLIVFISYVASKNSIIAIVLMTVLLLAFYFVSIYFVKDYLVGLIVKSSGAYKIGDQITVEGATGRISGLGRTQLMVKDTAGNTVYVPYSWLRSRVKTVQQKTEKINGYTFTFKHQSEVVGEDDTKVILQYIKLLPWTHPAFEPTVELDKQAETNIKVTVYAFDKAFHSKIESSVKDKFAKK